MTGLRTLIIQQYNATIAFDHSFWGTVGQTCLALEKLYFSGGPNCFQCHHATPGESTDLPSLWSMANLTTVNLTLRCNWNPGHHFTFQPALDMLLRCPKIKHLYLYHHGAPAEVLNIPEFCSLRFPELKTLCLTSIAFGDHTPSLLSSFISANSSVQEIWFLPGDHFLVDPRRGSFSTAVIDRLASINGTVEAIARLIGSGTPKKLKSMSVSFNVAQTEIGYQVLSAAGPYLEGLTFSVVGREGNLDWVSLTDLLRSNCPVVRRLTIQDDGTGSQITTLPDLSPSALASSLSGFQHLHSLAIPLSIADQCGVLWSTEDGASLRAAVFGTERHWPRSIEASGAFSDSVIVFGPDSNDSKKEFGIILKERLDGSEANERNKWTLWRHQVDHSTLLSKF